MFKVIELNKFIERGIFVIVLLLFYEVHICNSIDWKHVKCAGDDIDPVPEGGGTVPNSRFGWLGIVQHKFYMAEKTQFAITTGVLIHPGYVIAPAEDIGKIPMQEFMNATDFIVWGKGGEKYVLPFYDYVLHPYYSLEVTKATIAVLQLWSWFDGQKQAPVDALCLPLKGMGSFNNLFVIKMDDQEAKIRKLIFKMNYVVDKDCEEFYYRAQLTYEKMKPPNPICAVVESPAGHDHVLPCLWDNGSLLVARLNDAFWTLLGFGVRGPGCGAPSRFVGMHKMLEWVDATITRRPLEDLPPDSTAIFLRQLSPIDLTMYKSDFYVPNEYGQCRRGGEGRGGVQYKDSTEVASSASFGYGFFFTTVYGISQYSCATVKFETYLRSYTALWVEHNCELEGHGAAFGHYGGHKIEKFQCFLYFKTAAFIEFRYMFSFRGFVEMTLYGVPMRSAPVNPWMTHYSTDMWAPTTDIMQRENFLPLYWNKWN